VLLMVERGRVAVAVTTIPPTKPMAAQGMAGW
jgi:hypothetical protein